jgi:hypothetical protein
LKPLADSNRVVWHDLVIFILGWIYQRRPSIERDQLADAVRTADSSRKRKKEVSQMGTLMKGSMAYEMAEFMRAAVLDALEVKFKSVPESCPKIDRRIGESRAAPGRSSKRTEGEIDRRIPILAGLCSRQFKPT